MNSLNTAANNANFQNVVASEAAKARAERERLIAEHLPQVRLIARRIHDRLPSHVSLEDLISTGTIGLISAIDRYEPGQGVKLRTYAEYKIRGAILDSLRDLDWAPRKQRRRAKEIERAVVAAEQRTQKKPSEDEVALELGVSVEEYREWAAESRNLSMMTLDRPFADDDNRETMRQVPDRDEMLPSRLFERAELEQLLTRALERMPQQERTILSLYFHEEMSLREISAVVDLHESRVSQLKAQALGRLRTFLNTSWPDRGSQLHGCRLERGK